MMGQPKPLASLSSSLLARKGTARPAMRPQGFGGFGSPVAAQDDLGWNDMGEDVVPVSAPLGLTPIDAAPVAAPVPPVVVPPVLRQREVLREEFAAAPVTPPVVAPPVAAPVFEQPVAAEAPVEPRKSVSLATATRIGRETRTKHKAAKPKSAFTLRLDIDRHLKLRLASALQGRSAQLLVTEALDAFLETLPEVDALVSQLPARTAR